MSEKYYVSLEKENVGFKIQWSRRGGPLKNWSILAKQLVLRGSYRDGRKENAKCFIYDDDTGAEIGVITTPSVLASMNAYNSQENLEFVFYSFIEHELTRWGNSEPGHFPIAWQFHSGLTYMQFHRAELRQFYRIGCEPETLRDSE